MALTMVASAALRDSLTLPFGRSAIPAVNVAAVPQRSPLRYPGGKTWLVPHIRHWLRDRRTPLLVEPFAGGAIVSLTAVMDELAEQAHLVDLDRDVSAFWQAALEHSADLIALIRRFDPGRASVEALSRHAPGDLLEHGFRTLVLNRTRRGGVLAPGASLTRQGENGQGVSSRWYPATLENRLRAIAAYSDRLSFHEGDGVRVMETLTECRTDARFFVDPPYTAAGGKRAGSRLYAHNDVDHQRIFRVLADSGADFLMTYDCSEEIVDLVGRFKFHAVTVAMKNGHHARIAELIITRDRLFS